MKLCPVLVGRSAQIAALQAASDAGGCVLVSGEAGIGKSRLLKEFATWASERKHTVVWARAETITDPGPFALILDLLDGVGSLLGADDQELRTLGSTLSATANESEPPARQVAARLRGLLARVGRAPIVIVEDVHDADELSQSVLSQLARSAADDGSLIVVSYRPERAHGGSIARLLDLLTRDRIAHEIGLQALDSSAVREMLGRMSETEPSDDEIERLIRLADGIPFFVEELAAAREDASSIPATIARAVALRVEQLDERARDVIAVSSLLTGPIDASIVAEVVGRDRGGVESDLIASTRVGLLADLDGRLTFRHSLVRRTISEGIVSVERTSMHRRIADAIEARAEDSTKGVARALAEHRAEAGELGAAARHWLTAGQRALASGALDEASEAFAAAARDATDTETELGALAGMAEHSLRTRDWEGAAAGFRKAANGYIESGDVEQAAHCLSRIAWLRQLDSDREALSVLDEAVGLLAEHTNAQLLAKMWIEKGYALARVFDDPVGAKEWLDKGMVLAEELGDAGLLSEAHDGIAWVCDFEIEPLKADEHGELACTLALQSGRIAAISRAFSSHALRMTNHGRCNDAIACLDAARPRLLESHATVDVQVLDHMRVWTLWRMGFPAEADQVASSLEASAWSSWFAAFAKMWALAERSDIEGAERFLDAWWAGLGDAAHRTRCTQQPVEEDIGGPDAIAALAELFLRINYAPDLSRQIIDNALAYKMLCINAPPDFRALISLLYARALIRTGDLDSAKQAVDDVDEFVGTVLPLHRAAILELTGSIAQAQGRTNEAMNAFDQGAVLLSTFPNYSDRARCLRLAAEAELELNGSRDRIGERLREAREYASRSGAHAELNSIESIMRGIGLRPRAGRPKGTGRAKGELSSREQEVAVLVASGASNADIAIRLFISERTVQDHITSALRRLTISGRAALAAWAAKRGLV